MTPAATLALSWTIDNEVALLLLEIKTQLRSTLYPLLSALYIKPDGTIKIAGDTVQQPALASTLQKIAKLGPDYLYDTMASTIATGEETRESENEIKTEGDMKSQIKNWSILKICTSCSIMVSN